MVGYEDFRREQAAARAEGRYLGIGFSTYIEACGIAPSAVVGSLGARAGLFESAIVRVQPTGEGVGVRGQPQPRAGARDHLLASGGGSPGNPHGGRGHHPRRYRVRCRSAWAPTARAAWRSVAAPSCAAWRRSRRRAPRSPRTCWRRPRRTWSSPAASGRCAEPTSRWASATWRSPPTCRTTIRRGWSRGWTSPASTIRPTSPFPFGAHLCIVEVCGDTGRVTLKRFVAVDDVGNVVNPQIVDGQVHGGVCHGIGQALLEGAIYDADGQLVNGSYMGLCDAAGGRSARVRAGPHRHPVSRTTRWG